MADEHSKTERAAGVHPEPAVPLEGTCPRCRGPALFREALDGLAGACLDPLCGWTSTAVAGFGPPRR